MELEDLGENSIEEEITRSKFDFLKYNSLQACPSKNIFRERSPELTRPDSKKTYPFSFPRSPEPSVFDRLVSDSNRRTLNVLKIQSLREAQEKDSPLSPSRLSKESEFKLLERFGNDIHRRRLEQQSRELKKSESPKTISRKQSPENTRKMIERLFVDKRKEYQKRDEAKLLNIETENLALQKIREKRHPVRKLNSESLERISQRSPSCEHSKGQEVKEKKKWKDVKKIVERLYRSPDVTVKTPLVEDYFFDVGKLRKKLVYKFELETDDFLLNLKAKGRVSSKDPTKNSK